MAASESTEKVISRKNEGFPDWLNFEKLRQEGIDYLGNLSGKIWTDHNAHDPGITILEVLCYAMLDLGYRTTLPPEELFARSPDDNAPEDNFFTASSILGCNPVTIQDYRRLLIDIPGVRNAWLTVADDITIESLCGGNYRHDIRYRNDDCIMPLNGLYHVYLELETAFDNPTGTATPLQKEKIAASPGIRRTRDDVLNDVRKILLSHRNLCEDFYDITVLCPQPVGICADIELHTGTNPESLLPVITATLRDFLAPSPRFYRLQQLLEKGKTVEEIFAGRPINLTQSHGFVDVTELEKIQLRKEIHLSDLYNIILQIPGIASVRNLTIRNCDGSICEEKNMSPWIFRINEKHIPRFEAACSAFRFSSPSGTFVFDAGKIRTTTLNQSSPGKTLISAPSEDLDLLIEPGRFRPDLADYTPIENEFPRVYGITEGSLSMDATPERKAQSLQLKGYLLFFDTLLSGYLAQLKNIRHLFAFGTGTGNTYPVSRTPWPGLDKLVRFDIADSTSTGSPIAIPTDRKKLETLLLSDTIDDCGADSEFKPLLFHTATERDTSIRQLMEDLRHDNFQFIPFATRRGCWSFYFTTTSDDVAFLSAASYPTENDAKKISALLGILSANENNFTPYAISGGSRFSFNIVQSTTGYWDYLQELTENEDLYLRRKDAFLDHLLARFAESFTDYALLSWSFADDTTLKRNNIRRKDKFLSAYPELSSMRGKAENYYPDNLGTSISGLEKRFNALAGICQDRDRALCHFEVSEFDEQTLVDIQWKNESIFRSEQSYESRPEGLNAMRTFLSSSRDPANYSIDVLTLRNQFQVRINTPEGLFVHPLMFDTYEAAADASIQLQRMFAPTPSENETEPCRFEHSFTVTGVHHRWRRKDREVNAEPILNISPEQLTGFQDPSQWIAEEDDVDRGAIEFRSHPDNHTELVNIKAFDPYVNRVDVKKKKTLYRYTVSDPDKSFFFISEHEFDSEGEAYDNILRLLFLLTSPPSFEVGHESDGTGTIKIMSDGQLVATNTIEFVEGEEAQNIVGHILDYVRNNIFRLEVETQPVRWRHSISLGLPGGREYVFTGTTEHDSREAALRDASRLISPDEPLNIVAEKDELHIVPEDHPEETLSVSRVRESTTAEEAADLARNLLSFRKTIGKLHAAPDAEELQGFVVPDKLSKQGNFGYRLVRKNYFHAWYQLRDNGKPRRPDDSMIKQVYNTSKEPDNVLRICHGGDNIRPERDKKTGATVYHFVIRPIDGTGDDDPTDLFKSIKGYSSSEEAEKAFHAQYVQILTLASDPANIGSRILFEEPSSPLNSGPSGSDVLAFIPDATMRMYGYNTDHARQALSELAAKYPVRQTTTGSDTFTKLFLCGEPPAEKPERCQGAAEPVVYYFVWKAKNDISGSWISTRFFHSAEDALREFTFFTMLLKYRGNYHIQRNACDCAPTLYVREILAESKRRFPTGHEAWGPDGVEAFICASQSRNAFSMYRHRDGCCYSFNVSCGNLGLKHPCTYDSAEKRDLAMQRLYDASRRIAETYQKYGTADWSTMASELPPAIRDRQDRKNPCDMALDLIERFISHAEESNEITEPSGIAELSATEGSEAWEQLKRFAHYFPVRRKMEAGQRQGYKYFLRINLPDFCSDDFGTLENCGCGGDRQKLECCCTAWESECCFDTCEEALRYLYRIAHCLENPDNYYPVLSDSSCQTYGITFHCDCDDAVRTPDKTGNDYERHSVPSKDHCCNAILAFNPQCYTTLEMAHEAIDRAKCLINAEGLHVVEHILLRPHAKDGDCECLIPTCEDITPCHFDWSPPGDDPCQENIKYCFAPGTDPYSFIATVALPAWPERFRKTGNRQILEQLLYREAPAHVMLRVLWLNPHDLCEFETISLEWKKWIAGKRVCVDFNPVCRLTEFLFRYTFQCFECNECDPCPADNEEPGLCDFSSAQDDDPNKYVNAINDLYCWKPVCPGDEYRERIAARLEIQPSHDIETDATTAAEEERRMLDERFGRYREKASEITEQSAQNTNAEAARLFLESTSPDFDSYIEVTERVAANKRSPENRRVLSLDQKRELIRALTWYFLDHASIHPDIIPNEDAIKDLFRKLEARKVMPELKKWKAARLPNLYPGADPSEIKKLLKK